MVNLARDAFGQGLGLHESAIWNVGFIVHVVKPIIAEVMFSVKQASVYCEACREDS